MQIVWQNPGHPTSVVVFQLQSRLCLIGIVFLCFNHICQSTIRYDRSLSKSRFKGTHKCDTSACLFCPFVTMVTTDHIYALHAWNRNIAACKD